MAWATLAQFKTHQKNLAGAGDSLITLSLNMTGSRISSCLHSGGYSVTAIETAIAAGAVFDALVLLNIRLAAIDLMVGGGSSNFSGANNVTYVAWQKWAESFLELICSGKLALDNSGTGDDIVPPQADFDGIVGDTREAGVDLIDPLLWEDGDPVDADFESVEV